MKSACYAAIMEPTSEDLRHCSIAGTLALIGEKWSMLILRDVLSGVSRFDDFLSRLQCSPAVLSARLKTLTEAGLLRRVSYREPGARARFAYRPTRAAVELLPVLIGLMQWGDRHLRDGCGLVEVRSATSGLKVHAALIDEAGNEVPLNDLKTVRSRHAMPARADHAGASPSAAQADATPDAPDLASAG
ncbi:helix-turn-helix transcriptional regulator [Cupriavidus gilardii]|nr:helix-turn-helix domain-containing protein [Cupriavidus gilardii]UXC38329.1 helix-turn-helix transcriptional regulator [Cupriavidus gilardii]